MLLEQTQQLLVQQDQLAQQAQRQQSLVRRDPQVLKAMLQQLQVQRDQLAQQEPPQLSRDQQVLLALLVLKVSKE